MLLKKGDKILVAHRRLFEKDSVRFFVGHVDDYEAGIVKVKGHSSVRDGMTGLMIEKSDERTKILSIASGTLLVHQLPDAVELDGLRFEISGTQLLLTNGREFTMNLTEHPHNGQL
jgi:hypothetical protein